MACVVGVLLSMLSVSVGVLRAYRSGEDPAQAIVLSTSSPFEFGNGVPQDAVGTIVNAPGIAKGPGDRILADAEVLFWVPPTQGYAVGAPQLRGVGAAGLALRPQFRIVTGRLFQTGRQELIVGVGATRAFGLHVADKIILPGGEWPIVGTFSAGGSILEGQLIGDVNTIMTAGRMSGFGSIWVRLENPGAFAAFRAWLTTNPTLMVTAERQSDYALRTARRYSAYFTELAYVVGAVMAAGALFGAVKLMYAAVSVRTRELATLRAIGYQALPVAVSVIFETALLSLVGALLGACAAWLLFNGKQVADNANVYDLFISPGLCVLGVGWALGLAILGGLLPAIRGARASVADALRAG